MDEQLKRDIEASLARRAIMERQDRINENLARLTSDARAFKVIGHDGWLACIAHMSDLEIMPYEIERVLRSDRMATFVSAESFIASFRHMTYGIGPRAFYE